MKEIMQLGRWKDRTIESYLRPELLMPLEKLREIGTCKSSRTYECHFMCNCEMKQNMDMDVPQYRYQKNFHAEKYSKASDKSKINMARRALACKKERELQSATKIPKRVREAEKLLKSKATAKLLSRLFTWDNMLIKKKYDGDDRFFTFTIHSASKRWRRFQETCKKRPGYAKTADRAKKLRGRRGLIDLPNAKLYAMPQLVIQEDKEDAKQLLEEYNHFKANMPEKLKIQWKVIKPRGTTHRVVLNQIYLADEEIEAEGYYRKGNVEKARKIMRKAYDKLHTGIRMVNAMPTDCVPVGLVHIK